MEYELYVSILIDSDLFVFVCVDSVEKHNVKTGVVKKLLPNADANLMSSAELESNGFSMINDKIPDDVFAFKMPCEELRAILLSQLPIQK